jgi:V/A-type H+-transporting ATPase subunit E
MEGMEKIRDSIIQEAKSQANSILKEAEERAGEQVEEATRKAQAIKKNRLEKAGLEAEEAAKRMLSMAELDMRKEDLKAKQEIIDLAFSRALDRLKGFSGDEYRKMIVLMLKKAEIVGNEELVVSPKDREMFASGLLKQINDELGYSLKLSEETRNIEGGFILKSHGVEINNSFETLLRMERERIETEIADILFQQ